MAQTTVRVVVFWGRMGCVQRHKCSVAVCKEASPRHDDGGEPLEEAAVLPNPLNEADPDEAECGGDSAVFGSCQGDAGSGGGGGGGSSAGVSLRTSLALPKLSAVSSSPNRTAR